MKVTVNAGGRVVEIESGEDGMNAHRLANLAIETWRRTEPSEPETLGPAYGFSGERQHRDGFHRTSGYGGAGFREAEA